MRTKSRWRRFLPINPDDRHNGADVFGAARRKVDQLTSATSGQGHLRPFGDIAKDFRLVMDTQNPADWLTLLILQTPQAARAQVQMDKHPHGYHDREKRLYELIDFNDSFVSMVLLLTDNELAGFTERLWGMMEQFCEKNGAKLFTPEQFEAITHGLSREVAVFRAAKAAGFGVRMTSRNIDAFGIDMQIQDPTSGRYINVDCKTGSAFHFRLTELVHEGRIAPHDQDDAETKGFWEVVNRQNGNHIRVILFRVTDEQFGRIINFTFVDQGRIGKKLAEIIEKRGLSDGRFGMNINVS